MGCSGLHRQAAGAGPATPRASHPVPRRLDSGHPARHPSGQPSAVQTRSKRICAPDAGLRSRLTPSVRGRRPAVDAVPAEVNGPDEQRSLQAKSRAPSWAQRLKRVFDIDVSTCVYCCGADRGQHRRTQRDSRHPRPLREARRAGGHASPSWAARPTGCGCVTSPRPWSRTCTPKVRRRNQQLNAMRPRSRRAALGPVSASEGKAPRTARPRLVRRPPRQRNTLQRRPQHGQTDPCPPLSARDGAGKGRLNFLYLVVAGVAILEAMDQREVDDLLVPLRRGPPGQLATTLDRRMQGSRSAARAA